MFEAAELGVTVDKARFKKEAEKLRVALLSAQRELTDSNLSAIVVVGGVEGSGKTELANLLLEWMDARGIEVFALSAPTDEERERPRFWRFWRALPRQGRTTIYDRSWYGRVLVERLEGFCRPEDWRNREKWDAYQAAACDMIERTSTDKAPWVTVEGVDKRWARIKTIKTTCERLERILR